ncbi:DUF6090 family protein [Sinomicrobium kalidii]|uniref:DUF6090 family protein n=1 Tax=Sinomicrobium kalidii TaxID=2900738 RepID=UPI001E5BDFC1|nr:DUF6090 family protein [Sinomicrobium kalidii]UGU18309.1 DUF6090 family protein [Sinomicrobium kalidii]
MFRKLKQKLLKKNKIKSYLSYAIGEIVLIVIGILVAVSINNRNTKKQQEKVINGIFAIIIADLKQDTTATNKILNFYTEREPVFLKIAENIFTKDEISACELCPYLITERRLLRINKRGFHQLNEYKDLTLNHKDSLIFDIVAFYNSLINRIEPINDEISKDIFENLVFWRDTYPWFASLTQGKLKKEDMGYFASQEYRNKVAYHYTLIYKNHLPAIRTFRRESEILLKKLNDRLDKNTE